jgi:autotransporter-associated beta strand protein
MALGVVTGIIAISGALAHAANGTWADPVAIYTSALTSTVLSPNLTWSGSAFAVGQEVRFANTVPNGFTANTNYFVVYANGATIRLAAAAGGTAITATSAISNGTAQAYQSWQTAANWSSSAIADGTDAVATFTNAPVANVAGVALNGNITLGELIFANSTGSASDLSLVGGGSASNTLTLAVSGAVSGLSAPILDMPAAAARLLNLGGTGVLKISGTQGLLVDAPAGGALAGSGLAATGAEPAKALRVTNVDWSSFSGGITVETGYVQANAAGQLPAQTLTLGDTLSVTNNVLAGLEASTPQSIDALLGNSDGRVQGAFALTVGASGGSGSFGGIVGQSFSGATTATNLIKSGNGTQTITGIVTGTGAVTVNAGTLLMGSASVNTYTGATMVNNGGTLLADGTHMQGTGANAGAYTVASGGTLGGTGRIVLSDTNGTGTGMAVSGTLAPGDPATNGGIGTLTIDGGSSARPLLTLAAGATMSFDLAASFACSQLAIVNGRASDVVFNANTINFIDTSGGVLYAGQYVLCNGSANTTYGNLMANSAGVITSGLTIGSGLAAYAGSTLKLVGTDIVLNLVSPYTAPAAPLDTLIFGSTASETAHGLSSAGTTLNTAGGLGETCRELNPDTFLTFSLAVNPATNNYLTVKLWGADATTNTLYLYKPGATTSLPSSNHYGFYNTIDGVYTDIMAPIYLNLSGVAPFPGRFYYVTFLIPSALINPATGLATIQLGEVGALSPYAAVGSQEAAPSGPSPGIYEVYTGTDPYFSNSAGETQGTAPAPLTPVAPASVSSTISTLKAACTSAVATVAGWQIYGSVWSGVTSTSSAGASFSPIGAIYSGNNPASPPTLDQIATQTSSGNGVNMRIPSYLAQAYVTAWSGHYHDATYLDRVVKALDFCCLMQGSNGGLSTANGTGTAWVGAPNRITGGNPLEGYGTQGLGLALDLIYTEAQTDAPTNTLLQSYLSAMISDGVNTLTRRQAWENMFNNNVTYLTTTGRGHATNQDLAQMTAMWLENTASLSLGSSSALTTGTALQYVYSATGLAPSPLSATPSQAGYWFSPLGLPLEPWGTLGGGYDGNYGMANSLEEVTYLAQLTGDASVEQQALNAIDDSSQFVSPAIDDSGYSSWRKEETISTRSLEWPGRVDFLNDGMPYAASPAGLNNPIAQRLTEIAYQDNDVIAILPSSSAHYVDSIGYAFLNVDSYAAALQAPATVTRIATEVGQPDFAWADPQGCTVAAQQTAGNGDISRLYVELEWRRGFSSSTVRNSTTEQTDNIARIHYTTPTIDRIATINMDNPGGFGGLYACRYGSYFIAVNLNTTATTSYTMPQDLWGEVGENLVTGAAFTVPANGVIGVTDTNPIVFTVSAGPVVTSSPAATVASSGLSSSLSVAAADNTGASKLVYTWSTTGTSPAPVSFSVNGTNAAASTVASFSAAGTYTFHVTITDAAGLSTTGAATVNVSQVLTSLVVSPSAATVYEGATQAFSALTKDQFGAALITQPTLIWTLLNGGGTVNAVSGSYTAPGAIGSAAIQAVSASISGTAQISIVAPPISASELVAPLLNLVANGSGGTNAQITVKASVIGHTYMVEYNGNLATGVWQNIGSSQAGTGTDLVFVIPMGSTVTLLFYRVQVQ